MSNFFINALETAGAVIESGASLSDAVDLSGLRLFGLVLPTQWTTASITFQASYDGGASWHDMYDKDGNELTASAAASRNVVLDPTNFAAVPMMKVRSGTSGTPVAQGAARSVGLVLRSI